MSQAQLSPVFLLRLKRNQDINRLAYNEFDVRHFFGDRMQASRFHWLSQSTAVKGI